MAVRPILKMGHPLLRQRAAPVTEFGSAQLRALIVDMEDTMRAYSGAGIAAPQIGVSLQVVMFEVFENPRYPNIAPIPLTVLLNPELTPLDRTQEDGWEGCLSVPGLRGLVSRYSRLYYRAFTPDGVLIEQRVEGFHARVVQHEVDHLRGVLYPERLKDIKSFGFEDALTGQMAPRPARAVDAPDPAQASE